MKTKKILTLCLLTVFVLATVLSIGISALAFSDEYEPIYPHLTAVTRSVDEIYDRISGKDIKLPEEVVKARKEMIQMYKDVGIDVSYDMENWLGSYKVVANFPQRWSTETPIPLGESPDYSGAFSVDAPWNNKIPEGSPRVLIPRSGMKMHIHIGVVKANIDNGGWGTGIPQIVSTSADPYYTIASKYNSAEVSRVFKLRAKEGLYDYVNNAQTGDEHIMFIDAESNTGVQIWKATVPGDPRGFDLTNYRIPGFDVRAKAASYEYKLDGIGAEGTTGVNAVNTPTNAYTIKSSEISSTTEMINHAIGGAIPQMISARVYPGVSTDSHMHMESDGTGSNGNYNTGVLPYGGLLQLDPELDIKAMYDAGKLSFHSYRILTCMQEYGFYNIDCSGGSSFFFYTSTYANDWKNPEFRGFDVPYKNNAQGFDKVIDELTAFFKGDSFFGLTEEPGVYVTIPVAKYADLDVNDDGVIDQVDHDLVVENVGAAYTDANKQYDVNQDKEITPADIEIMYNYLNDMPMHTFNWYDATFTDNDETHGRIVGSAFTRKMDGVTKYRDGMMVSFAAVPNNGWEFAGWTGDFEKYGTEPVVKLIMDKDYSFGAKYKKKAEKSFTIKVVGPGHVEVSENAITYGAPKEKYGVDTLLKLKAVADEGYEFLGWGGDLIGYTNPQGFLVSKDSEVIAMFGEPGFSEKFDPETWEVASGSSTAYKVTAGKNVTFTDWSQGNQIAINNNKDKSIDLTGDFALRATLDNKATATNAGMLVFNYKNNKNYYYVKLGGDGSFSFVKVYNGVTTTLKSASKVAEVNGTQFKGKVILEVVKSGSYITINGYKDGVKHEYCKVRDKSLTGGTYGAGGAYNAAITVSGIKLTKSVADASKATVQVWSPTGNNDPWLAKLRGAVAVAAGSSKAYANDDYTSIPGDGSIQPYFGADGITVYVPVRYVTEALGGKITYDPATDSVVVSLGEHSANFKAWTDGAQEVNGTLYVPGDKLAEALGKQYYQYEENAPVIFSDTVNVYDPNSEPECIEFVKKTFDMQYYM